jgi:hypothetical protein
MKFDTTVYSLPAYWASYLINGDASGLEAGEEEQIDAFLKREHLPAPVSCSDEPRFSRYNDAGTGLGGDVLDYTFLEPRKETRDSATGMTPSETAALHRQGICPMD